MMDQDSSQKFLKNQEIQRTTSFQCIILLLTTYISNFQTYSFSSSSQLIPFVMNYEITYQSVTLLHFQIGNVQGILVLFL